MIEVLVVNRPRPVKDCAAWEELEGDNENFSSADLKPNEVVRAGSRVQRIIVDTAPHRVVAASEIDSTGVPAGEILR
jgi:hypothetical protein